MRSLSVRILRLIDDSQPGWAECEFTDADGRKHSIVDKVPIFVADATFGTTDYPRSGIVRCEVLAQWRDASGRELRRITTARPDDVTSNDGFSEFVVLADQLS